MSTRNILDSLGNIIGELSLPDDTSEDTWTQKLEEYGERSLNERWNIIRQTRIELFKATEWIRFRHSDELAAQEPTTLTAEQYQFWVEYWQSLRNLPEQYTTPEEVIFPVQPS